MDFPDDRLYSIEHEWVQVEGNQVRIGITDYAQDTLGDVVFVELPMPGDLAEQGQSFGVVESVKSVSDIYVPVSGQVVAVNEAVLDQPALLNQDPYGSGWLVQLEMNQPEQLTQLLKAEAYQQTLKDNGND